MAFLLGDARRWLASLTLIVAAFTERAAGAAAPDDLPTLFPGQAIAYVELSEFGEKLDQLRESDHFAAILASPQYERYQATPDYRRLKAVLEIAERQLGWDAWTTAKKLLGGKVAIGVYPKEGSERPDVLAIVHTSWPNALAELRQRLDPMLVLAAEQVRRTESLEGVETFTLPNDAATVAWKGDWLAVATSRQLLEQALERLSGKTQRSSSLTDDAPYQAMEKSIAWNQPIDENASRRILRGYVDTALLNKATGGKPVPQKLDNALGSLLFGDVIEFIRTSPFAAVTADVGASGLSLTASVGRDAEKLDEAYRAFAPAEGPGVSPPPRVPELLGGFALYRNFAQWYAHREDLLQEQVMPGFDKFETGLANLLPGRDFGEDVLPLIGKRITFVAAPQTYAHLDGEPGVKLPGMALIIELAEPDEAASLLQLFFQTLAAILNLEAGQQGRQPWVVTSENYHEVQVSYAKYLKKPAGKELGIVFNFQPASARVGDRYILSSSLPLCQQLVDSLRQPAGEGSNGRPPRTVLAELHFDSVASMVESNTDFFVGRMVQEGRTTDEAQQEFTAVLDLLRRFDVIHAATEVLPTVYHLRLEGKWK
jgi:hypothetical protein